MHDAEAIRAVADLALLGEKVQVVAKNSRTMTIAYKGKIDTLEMPRPDVSYVLHGVPDVLQILKDEDIADAPRLFVGESSIEVLLCAEDRRETVSMNYEPTEAWSSLLSLQIGRSFDVPDAVRFLRYGIGRVGAVDDLVVKLREVDFKRTSSASFLQEHGRADVSREVVASVTQADKIPTSFVCQLPPFRNVGLGHLHHVCEVGIDFDFSQSKIIFRLMPDACALNAWMDACAKDLRDKVETHVPVYVGTPNVSASE